MSQLFPHYGMALLVAAVVLLLAGIMEASSPVVSAGQIVARYPLCLRMMCVVLIVFCVFFAFALVSVQHDPPLVRFGIWSLLGIPTLALSAEVFSRRIALAVGSVSRSSVWQRRFSRQLGGVSTVTYDDSSKVFRVRFTDGATLHLPMLMRGSQQIARALIPPADRLFR